LVTFGAASNSRPPSAAVSDAPDCTVIGCDSKLPEASTNGTSTGLLFATGARMPAAKF
jgi:hypothetical protein